MARVCDGNPDCPLGDDEKSCVALADELENNEVIPYNEEGNNNSFTYLSRPLNVKHFYLLYYGL